MVTVAMASRRASADESRISGGELGGGTVGGSGGGAGSGGDGAAMVSCVLVAVGEFSIVTPAPPFIEPNQLDCIAVTGVLETMLTAAAEAAGS